MSSNSRGDIHHIIAQKFRSARAAASTRQRSARILYWFLAGSGAILLGLILRKLTGRNRDPWQQIMSSNKAADDREIKQKLIGRKKLGENQWDVAIVGAGPAGSTAAFYLVTRYGLRVLLLEKDCFPRDKICGYMFPADTRRYGHDRLVDSDGGLIGLIWNAFLSYNNVPSVTITAT